MGRNGDLRVGDNRRIGGLIDGDLEEGEIYLGVGAGLIDEVLDSAEVIRRSVARAREAVARLHGAWNSHDPAAAGHALPGKAEK